MEENRNFTEGLEDKVAEFSETGKPKKRGGGEAGVKRFENQRTCAAKIIFEQQFQKQQREEIVEIKSSKKYWVEQEVYPGFCVRSYGRA